MLRMVGVVVTVVSRPVRGGRLSVAHHGGRRVVVIERPSCTSPRGGAGWSTGRREPKRGALNRRPAGARRYPWEVGVFLAGVTSSQLFITREGDQFSG